MDPELMRLLATKSTLGLDIHPAFIILALIWSLVWKGLALWKSAGLRQRYWFIAILVVNTFGLLEIIYIFFVARKYKVEYVEKSE